MDDLADALAAVTFSGLTEAEVNALLADTVVAWATAHGWRVYRRAPSVVPLPPPMEHRQSVIDVACARPDGPPLVVEIDHTDRQRTIDKLLAEAGAGRTVVWVRWGTGRFTPPPSPIVMLTVPVTAARGHGFSRDNRPPPSHSPVDPAPAEQADLF